MSVTDALARNRAVFSALTSGDRPLPATEAPLRPLSLRDREARTAQPSASPAPPAARGAGAEEAASPRREELPGPTVYTLGPPPALREPWEAADAQLTFPEPEGRKAASPVEEGWSSDQAYQTLLRRFDADARRASQLMVEEASL